MIFLQSAAEPRASSWDSANDRCDDSPDMEPSNQPTFLHNGSVSMAPGSSRVSEFEINCSKIGKRILS